MRWQNAWKKVLFSNSLEVKEKSRFLSKTWYILLCVQRQPDLQPGADWTGQRHLNSYSSCSSKKKVEEIGNQITNNRYRKKVLSDRHWLDISRVTCHCWTRSPTFVPVVYSYTLLLTLCLLAASLLFALLPVSLARRCLCPAPRPTSATFSPPSPAISLPRICTRHIHDL